MSILEAILLGLLQGLTEFLPISSTAHLTIAGLALGLVEEAGPERWTAFLAVVQLGTLAAVLWYFRRDLLLMAQGAWVVLVRRDRANAEELQAYRLAWLLVLGTIPIGVVGLLLQDVIEGPLTKDLRVIAGALIGLALLLWLADALGTRARGMRELGWRDALIVGGAQVLSLVPGASRAGTTLTGGLLAGLTRETAARFSFLLSIPAIGASAVFQLPTALAAGTGDVLALAIATFAAAVSGYLAIAFMIRYLRTRSTAIFVIYRIALGGFLIAALAMGWF